MEAAAQTRPPDLTEAVREGLDQGAAKREDVRQQVMQELGYWNQRAGFISHLHAEALANVLAAEERCRSEGVTDQQMQRRLEGLARPTEPFRGSDEPTTRPAALVERQARAGGKRVEEAGSTAAANGRPGDDPEPERAEAAPAAAPKKPTPAAAPKPAPPKPAPAAAAKPTPARPPTPSPFEPAGSGDPRSGPSKRTGLFETVQALRASARAARKRRADSRP